LWLYTAGFILLAWLVMQSVRDVPGSVIGNRSSVSADRKAGPRMKEMKGTGTRQ
jgi:hypothetical protein